MMMMMRNKEANKDDQSWEELMMMNYQWVSG